MKQIHAYLEEAGFSETEGAIYIEILKGDKVFISDIEKATHIKRGTVINHIKKLLDKGLISQTIVGKRTAYIGESPELITQMLDDRKKSFLKGLPTLQGLFSEKSGKPKVRYFEGIKGLESIYREVTNQHKPILSFISLDRVLHTMGIESMNFFRDNRIKNGTKIKDLVEDTQSARDFMKQRKSCSGNENKWLPKTFPVEIDLLIWGDEVAMISFEKQMGVIISNKEIASFQRNLHTHFWELL